MTLRRIFRIYGRSKTWHVHVPYKYVPYARGIVLTAKQIVFHVLACPAVSSRNSAD